MSYFLLKKVWCGLWASPETLKKNAHLEKLDKIQQTIIKLQHREKVIKSKMSPGAVRNKDDDHHQLQLQYRAVTNLLKRALHAYERERERAEITKQP